MKMTHPLWITLLTTLITTWISQTAFAETDDEFGISFAPAVNMKPVNDLSISVEGEVRSRDMSHNLERLAVGAYFGYKPIQFFKAEVGYTFIDQYKSAADTGAGEHTEHYWAPKHETEVSLFGYLPIGFMEISLRERYEYTWHHEVHAMRWTDTAPEKVSALVKASKTEHVLRSRIQIAASIPDISFSPYGSFDVYNNLADAGKLFNFRVIFGGDYAITKSHKIGAYFRADLFYGVQNNYLLGLKYQYSI